MQERTDFVQSFKQHCIEGEQHARDAVDEVSAPAVFYHGLLMHLLCSCFISGARAGFEAFCAKQQ